MSEHLNQPGNNSLVHTQPAVWYLSEAGSMDTTCTSTGFSRGPPHPQTMTQPPTRSQLWGRGYPTCHPSLCFSPPLLIPSTRMELLFPF